MRILHIITRMIVGGAQENTLLTCEGLRQRGHEVILLTGPSLGAEGSLMERSNVTFEVRHTRHLLRAPDPWHDWMAYREIARLCRELKPDVVHTHSSKAGILGRGAAWKVRRENEERGTRNEEIDKPLVVHTIHGLAFHPYQNKVVNKAWVGLERWAARRCDAIISVADAMTRQALAEGIGREDQYTTIYSGMDVGPFVRPRETREQVRQRLGIPESRIVFGTIARLQPLKGHDDLLAVAGEVLARVPDAHFLWIGDGVFRARFEAMIREKGWGGHFTLTGLITPREVPGMLPAMDVLVHPSYREGLARALPQGLLAGKPVISYDCDGAGEVCIAGRTGYIVRTGDAAGLRDAMVTLAQNREMRDEMGQAGQALCLTRFPTEVMVARIEELYNRLRATRGERMRA